MTYLSSRPTTVHRGGVVRAGDAAPDATLLTIANERVALADLWSTAGSGLALVFLRHFGCPFCKEHALELHRQRDAFRVAGVDIVMIGTGTTEEAATFIEDLGLHNPVLIDHGRVAYRAYGLGVAPARSLFDPRVLASGVRAATKGFLPRRSHGHPFQLQGQFLIDRSGIIRSASRSKRMSEIPSARALLAQAEALCGEITRQAP